MPRELVDPPAKGYQERAVKIAELSARIESRTRNRTHGMQATIATQPHRVQVCPLAALAAVAARENAEACGRIPAQLLATLPAPRCPPLACPPDAVARLEHWLCATRGCELRKAKSSAASLRAVAHVACVWLQPTVHVPGIGIAPATGHLASATQRPPAPAKHGRLLDLPSRDFAGHLIGKGGKYVRPLLELHVGMCIRFEGAVVHIIASTTNAADDVLWHFQRKIISQQQAALIAAARIRDCHHTRARGGVEPDADLSEQLEQEREYRERNLRRKKGTRQRCDANSKVLQRFQSKASCQPAALDAAARTRERPARKRTSSKTGLRAARRKMTHLRPARAEMGEGWGMVAFELGGAGAQTGVRETRRGRARCGARQREQKPRGTAKRKAFALANALQDFPLSIATGTCHPSSL